MKLTKPQQEALNSSARGMGLFARRGHTAAERLVKLELVSVKRTLHGIDEFRITDAGRRALAANEVMP